MWKNLSKFVCVIAVCVVSVMNACDPMDAETETTTPNSMTEALTTEVFVPISPRDDGPTGKFILAQTGRFTDYLTNFIKRTRSRAFMNYSTMMDQTLTGIVDEEMNSIRCLVNVTSHGAVAENACYQAANESISDLVVTVYNNLRPCMQEAVNSDKDAWKNIENIIESIKRKPDDLTHRQNDCRDKPQPDANTCLSNMLPDIETNFCRTVITTSRAQAILKRTVQQLKDTCKVCLDRVNATTRASIEPIRASVHRCICNNGVTSVTNTGSCIIPAVPIVC